MESLIDFYSKYYTNTIANEMNDRICIFHGVSPNSEQGKIFYNTITTFFFLGCDELKKVLNANLEPLKEKIANIPDEEYPKVLERLSITVVNTMSDYYMERIEMLSNELNKDVSPDQKIRINKYVSDILSMRMINMLKDKFMYAIKVICNNSKENNQVMETINEKTVNKEYKKE